MLTFYGEREISGKNIKSRKIKISKIESSILLGL